MKLPNQAGRPREKYLQLHCHTFIHEFVVFSNFETKIAHATPVNEPLFYLINGAIVISRPNYSNSLMKYKHLPSILL